MKTKVIQLEEDGEMLRPRFPVIMSCDPGKNGGLCWNDRFGKLHACAMPETVNHLANVIRDACPDFFLLERVRSSPQMGVVSAFTFGQGVGNIVGILATLRIFWRDVTPQTWMKSLGLGKTKDHANIGLWKKHLLREAKSRVPHLFRGLNVGESLRIADAVLLHRFAKEVHRQYHFK